MSSIMTNASAMTALKTLNMTNKNLEKTQSHISTGYRVAEAADNAAYWSISTTMRSDNKALSTVNDALGLGKSTVDVAYTALNSAKDVLDAIKTKLVAAKQPGVDREKVQSEIGQLQNQLKGIASAASFSGSNWLSVDSDSSGYSAIQKVVSSFSRGSDGSLTVGAIDIDTSKTALFNSGVDSGTGASLKGIGLLDKGIGNTSAGTLATTGTSGATATAGKDATSGVWKNTNAFTFTKGDAVDGDDLKITVTVDGTAQAKTLDIADVETFGLDDIVNQLNSGGTALSGAKAANVDGKLVITSTSTGTSSTIAVSAVSIVQNGTSTARATAATNVGTGAGTAGAVATSGSTSMTQAFTQDITLDGDDTISFNIAVNGGVSQKITVNRADVDAALSSTDGRIGSAASMKSVLDTKLTGAGVTISTTGSKLTFTSNATGASSGVTISGVDANNGGNSFGVMDIDITKADANLDEYISGIDKMAKNVTTAASDLGAVKSRIGMQTDFVKNLMDAIDRGVGTLVDADMNEESTKLQALQVQQQLGIQALSMANSNAQTILSLFRG